MTVPEFIKFYDLINSRWLKRTHNHNQTDWFQEATKLGPLGYCNMCHQDIGPRNSHNLRYSKQYELIIEHGLIHFPNLKLFI